MWEWVQTAGRFGGFLLFTEVPGFSTTPVEGLEVYWASEPHVAFVGTYVDTLYVNDDGRGVASVQVCDQTHFGPFDYLNYLLQS